MDKPNDQLVEEVVAAIKRGDVTLETAPARYSSEWSEIEPQVRFVFTLEAAAQSFKAGLPTFNSTQTWQKIEQGLGTASTNTSADSGSTPADEQAMVTPVVPVESIKPKAPLKLSRLKRTPLRWAAAFLLLAILGFGSAAGVAQAASPGDGLYDFKVWLDTSGSWFAFTPEAKAQANLTFADHRLGEIEQLTQQGRFQYIGQVINLYNGAIDAVETQGTNLTATQQQTLAAQHGRLLKIKETLVINPQASEAEKAVDQADQKIVTNNSPTTPQITEQVQPIGVTPSITETVTTLTPQFTSSAAGTAISQPVTTPLATISPTSGTTVTPALTPTPASVTNAATTSASNTSAIRPTVALAVTVPAPTPLPPTPVGQGNVNSSDSGVLLMWVAL